MPATSTKPDQIRVDKNTGVAKVITNACCTCNHFHIYDHHGPFEEPDTEYMAEGECHEKKSNYMWRRGYFGCEFHKLDPIKALKIIAKKGTNVAG